MSAIVMKRTIKQRVLVTIVATLVLAACGLLAGYWIGREIALRLTAGRLSYVAAGAIGESDMLARDAHTALDAMNASRNPDCAESDMVFLRNLLYHSHLLKEIGRIRDNRIACSATLGREHLPSDELPKPEFIGTDGVKVYKDPPVFRLPDVKVTALQARDSYVVLFPYNDSFLERYSANITEATLGQPPPSAAGSTQPSWPLLIRNGDFRIGQILYSTRCSSLSIDNICWTASLSVSEAMQANRGELKALTALGGLTGGFFGFAVSLLYRRNRDMEHQLRRAISRGKLQLVYQPIVSLPSGRIVGAEALARWTDEEGFAVGPDIFVKVAEAHGFVGEITKSVIRCALREFGDTMRRHPDFRLSINVAAADLSDPRFLPALEKSLDESQVQARSLAIEVTESSTARHEVAIAAIRQLSRRGHDVHIDDFGTGYSSLSYLNGLAIHAIKIDRSFTQAIGTEAVTVSILPQILAMAAALKLNVIVEGVETAQQAGYFAGCGQPVLAQGWLYGRPISAEQFHEHFGKAERRAMSPAEHIPAEVCSVS